MKPVPTFARAAAVAALAAALLPSPAAAQAVIKVNENVNFKLGFQFQGWADWSQSAATGGYAQNLFARRARLLVGGQVAKDVTFFFQTDSGNLGKVNPAGAKQTNTGFVIQDAFVSWKLNDAFTLEAGHFLVPLSRNILQSTLSFFTLDISPASTVMAGPTQTNGLRDNGFQTKGYLVDGGRLEYRAAVMQGVRDSASRNSFRTAGYLQYNFFETERGYVFAGTNLGKKKVVNVSAGFDVQKDYRAFSGDVFAAVPVAKGDEVGGQVQFIRYDGGDFLAAIPKQDDLLAEAAYYLSSAKVQPFVKYESQSFANAADEAKDVERFGGGLNWYVSGQNFKLTAQYLRVEPKSSAVKPTNQFTLQLQAFYF